MLDCLTTLVKSSPLSLSQPTASSSGSLFPGLPATRSAKERTEEQVGALTALIMASRDELAHVTLFNWMIDMGMQRRLVTLHSPFVEAYLLREIKEEPRQSRLYLDLLWRHYDFRKDYASAAKVLAALAERYGYTFSSHLPLQYHYDMLRSL
jgi:hypothetical protein